MKLYSKSVKRLRILGKQYAMFRAISTEKQ
jgi:hypothetical protein